MFRNGLAAARHPLARPLVTVACPRRDALPVCLSCQLRSLATKARRGRPANPPRPEGEISLSAIKRLEQHVQHMERRYADILKKEAATRELPDRDLTGADSEAAYAELMAPPSPAVTFLPKPKKMADRLPAPIRERLGEGMALIMAKEQPEWESVLVQLESKSGFVGMEVRDVHRLLTCMDVPQRATVSAKVLEMMGKAKLKPETLTYDLFMMAHAVIGHSAGVKALFCELQSSELKPTVYSYGHLLKAYYQETDTIASAAAFQEMHAASIEPNLVTYTTLIQTYLRADQLDTAWHIFNVIKFKSTATAPDESTYTLMIHACAENGETERALDLYTDMTTRRNLEPTAETFIALIHACAVRKDYFLQAWKFATDMQNQGIQITRKTLNVLIQACGRTGDLTRARLLVRHMMASNHPDLIPDQWSYQGLLRAYATYNAERRSEGTPTTHGDVAALTDSERAVFMTPNTELAEGTKRAEAIPFIRKSVLGSSREVLDEAALVVNWLRDAHPDFVDTQLMNAYLDVCLDQPSGKTDLIWSYDNDYEKTSGLLTPDMDSPSSGTPENPEVLAPASEPYAPDTVTPPVDNVRKLPRNIYTFSTALQGAVKFRNLDFAQRVWADRMAFTKTESYWRLQDKVREKMDFDAEKRYIDALALGGRLEEAAERAEVLSDEYEWSFEDLQMLYVKAVQLEDKITAEFVKKVTGWDEMRRPGEVQDRYYWPHA